MNSIQNPKSKIQNSLLPWLDVLAILAWGVLLIKYWLTGKLNLLIHPDYFWLVVVTGISLLLIGGLKATEMILKSRQRNSGRDRAAAVGHITLFRPGVSSMLLLIVAIMGLFITPKVFASQTAIDRGITESLTVTRSQPQQFRPSANPEERSLVDWVRTLNVYPEPDAYSGQKVKVRGFVVHPPNLPEQYLLVSRFVITCCAADAYPIGLPVKLKNDQRQVYPPDSWVEIQGQMITEDLGNKRQLVIAASGINKITAPENPYDY